MGDGTVSIDVMGKWRHPDTGNTVSLKYIKPVEMGASSTKMSQCVSSKYTVYNPITAGCDAGRFS